MLNKANNYFASQLGIAPLAIEFFKDWGLNSIIAETVFSNGKASKIRINLCRVVDSQVLALGHEYIHVSQVLAGKLEIRGQSEFWCGKCCDSIPYIQRPHEIEARKLQFSWYQNFNAGKQLTLS